MSTYEVRYDDGVSYVELTLERALAIAAGSSGAVWRVSPSGAEELLTVPRAPAPGFRYVDGAWRYSAAWLSA